MLDSNTDFTSPWLTSFAAQPAAFERRFRTDFATWAAKYDDRLHLGTSPRLVVRGYERLRAALKKQPVTEEFMDGAIRITYDQNTLDQMVAADMYTKLDFYSLALDLAFLRDLSAAQTKGGPRAAQHKIDALSPARQRELVRRAHRTPVGLAPFGDDYEDATFTAITCNDTAWPQGQEHADQLAGRLGPRNPLIGWTVNENPCFYWDRPRLNLPQPTGHGLPTTLMVQSAHDPATSYSLATAAHQRYAGSRLLTVTGEGDHGVYGGVNRCADRIVEAFLTTGRAPGQDVSCRGEGIPAPNPVPDVPGADDGAAAAALRDRSPLRRIQGFSAAISGYLH